jgi:hypothetical protein
MRHLSTLFIILFPTTLLAISSCPDVWKSQPNNFDPNLSHGSISIESGGGGLSVWSHGVTPDQALDLQISISPQHPIVIGRQQGGRLEYLDPRYSPTQMMPSSNGNVLNRTHLDTNVSRGHFMLKNHAHGILLVNGVPYTEGGIRPPKNGTVLLSPESRMLAPAEEFLIESGTSAKILLPNGTVILINAE